MPQCTYIYIYKKKCFLEFFISIGFAYCLMWIILDCCWMTRLALGSQI